MVAFVNLFVRSSRRIRLEFSSALAGGAFVPSWFTLVCNDSSTADPGVVAALAVAGGDRYVELALDRDLAEDGQYTVSVGAGVPALDATTAGAASQLFNVPAAPRAPSETTTAKELSDIIFQEDIAHNPTTGHVLGPDGDLAVLTGPENVKATGLRGLLSEGLPHRAGWGANLREDVDSPDVLLAALRGKLERQLRRDDRIVNCKARANNEGNGDVVVIADLDLIGQVKANIRSPVNARS